MINIWLIIALFLSFFYNGYQAVCMSRLERQVKFARRLAQDLGEMLLSQQSRRGKNGRFVKKDKSQ
jgi:hypothetical protein